MRTRLDRGRYTDGNGKVMWAYGHYTEGAFLNPNTGEETKRHLISNADGLWDVAPESVGEWTSLYDYSTPKKRIFEGDILAHVRDPHFGMYEVYYDETSAAYFARSVRIERKEEPLTALLACPWWVVCGNLIDNPEYQKLQ